MRCCCKWTKGIFSSLLITFHNETWGIPDTGRKLLLNWQEHLNLICTEGLNQTTGTAGQKKKKKEQTNERMNKRRTHTRTTTISKGKNPDTCSGWKHPSSSQTSAGLNWARHEWSQEASAHSPNSPATSMNKYINFKCFWSMGIFPF